MARGRPRQFDEEQVLGKAAQLFRERGYEATSMQALSGAMNMGEQSIYNAFGSKERVFQRALERYCVETERDLQILSAPGAARGAIEAFFSMAIDTMSRTAPACLVARTCLTHEADDTAAARRASRHMRKIETYFLRAVMNAVERDESHCDDPKNVARFLNMTLQGLGVMARSGTSKRALREMADVSLRVLR